MRTGTVVPEVLLTFKVDSSDGHTTYSVTRHADGSWVCTCPDFTYRQHGCKHISRCRMSLADSLL